MSEYYETNDAGEVSWLCMHDLDDLLEFVDWGVLYAYKKSPKLFLCLADYYNQKSLRDEYAKMENAFIPCSKAEINVNLLPGNPLIGGEDNG